jgi:hypothetical protein
MNRPVPLGPADLVESRLFAHPDHNAADLEALAAMAARLQQLLLASGAVDLMTPGQIYELHTPAGRRLRVVVSQPAALRGSADLPVVGFFGHRRPVVPPDVIADKDAIDLELIAEFPRHPGVLAYCSMALDDADYGNLVIMAQPETRDQWSTSARHAFASRLIAPQYYATIRLHNAVLPGGLASGCAPVLVRTKYYDYRDDWHWSAVREYGMV